MKWYKYMKQVAKGVGDDVGEADDDVPLKLKWCTIAAENKGGELQGGVSFDTSSWLHTPLDLTVQSKL